MGSPAHGTAGLALDPVLNAVAVEQMIAVQLDRLLLFEVLQTNRTIFFSVFGNEGFSQQRSSSQPLLFLNQFTMYVSQEEHSGDHISSEFLLLSGSDPR